MAMTFARAVDRRQLGAGLVLAAFVGCGTDGGAASSGASPASPASQDGGPSSVTPGAEGGVDGSSGGSAADGAAAPASVTVSPASVAVAPGASQAFTCAIGGVTDSCTWSVQEAAGGAIGASGLYTAPQTVGTYHVVAVRTADPTQKGSAFVVVAPRGTPGVWRDITPPQIDKTKYPCTDLQFDPSNPSTLLAYFGDGGGIWKSTDAGATWTTAPTGNLPMPNSLGRLLVDPKDSKHLYVVGSVTQTPAQGFWVSHDGGTTWAIPKAFSDGAKAGSWNDDVYNMVADPTDFDHVLLTFHSPWSCCGEAAGILETFDGGASFVAHAPAAGMDHAQGIAMLYDPAHAIGDAKTWLVGAGYGANLYRTTNAGASWDQVSTVQQDHGGFDAHYSSQGFLYIGAVQGIYRSKDNGATWEQETQGVSASYYYSVIGDGTRLYSAQAFVGVEYNAPFIVTPEGGPNEGAVWTPLSQQVIPQGPFKMVFDATSGVIYDAAWGSGAWALTVQR
jgi:hypothetical protein